MLTIKNTKKKIELLVGSLSQIIPDKYFD